MASKRFRVGIRKWHRWLAYLLAVQLAFWIFSGFYFSVVPLATVRGRDQANHRPQPTITSDLSLADLESTLNKLSQVKRVTLHQLPPHGLVFEADTAQERVLFNAHTGERLSRLTKAQALELARLDFKGKLQTPTVRLLHKPTANEFRGPFPAFRVDVGDARNTALYFDAYTGELLARRNDFWRVFDFLWMLHILDFGDRTDFNNNLLRTASGLGSMFLLTGVGLIFWGRVKRRAKS
jgi:uncharacterized iron-regulated membrane protein